MFQRYTASVKKLFSSQPEGPGAPLPARNEPCHCGSGKKYKACCLPRDQRKGRR